MATLKLYLDKRKGGEFSSLRIAVYHNARVAYISLDIRLKPEQWNEKAQRVVGHPNRVAYNSMLEAKMSAAERALLSVCESGGWRQLSATQLKDRIVQILEGSSDRHSLASYFRAYAERARRPNTRDIYLSTLHKMEKFEKRFSSFTFEDITHDWLTSFQRWMERDGLSVNAISIHLRNLRAVVNAAIDEGRTANYAFRRFKIKSEKTLKRSLTVDQLRTLFDSKVEPWAQPYLDCFKLSFYLLGINIGDLCHLTGLTDGRIVYHRAKTNSLLNIKVEPEAAEILERYKGDEYLLNFLETHTSYISFYHQLNRSLKMMVDGEPFCKLSTYWARHTWATIAASLDIPKETIAHALGHVSDYSGVTDTYIRFDDAKVDEANRRVLDFVLGK